MPVDEELLSGRVQLDAEKQSGRLRLDVQSGSGRVRLDEEMQSGRMQLERFLAKLNGGRIIVRAELITRPDDSERTTAQKYFRHYEPAEGKKLTIVTAGNRHDNSQWEAHVGSMAYYQEPMDYTLAFHGPYRILDIRIAERFISENPPKIEIWLDRFDFLTPLSPARLYKAEMIDALL